MKGFTVFIVLRSHVDKKVAPHDTHMLRFGVILIANLITIQSYVDRGYS